MTGFMLPGTRSEFDGSRSMFDGMRSMFDGSRFMFDGSRSEFDGSRSMFDNTFANLVIPANAGIPELACYVNAWLVRFGSMRLAD